MKLFTIGTNKKTAKNFFSLLAQAKVETVIDTRLNNKSQLAGYARYPDLEFFLGLHNIGYQHLASLAPEKWFLDEFRNRCGSVKAWGDQLPQKRVVKLRDKKYRKAEAWKRYVPEFNKLMAARQIEKILDHQLFVDACLLCACDTDKHCHRFLVADYLKKHWPEEKIHIRHLL